MDGNRYDNRMRQGSQGEVDRRQLVIGSLALAAGASGASRLARAQEADPTPAPDSVQGQTGETEQQFPCPPGPTGPYDWICGNGPFIPWYPVVAPPHITAATGVRWYGFQIMEDGSLRAEAFDRTNGGIDDLVLSARLARQQEPDRESMQLEIGSGAARIQAFVEPPRANGSQIEISGEINGNQFRLMIDQDGFVVPDASQTIELDPEQEQLLEIWQAPLLRLDSMMGLAASSGDDPFAASDFGCFMAGAIAVPSVAFCAVNPAGCVIAGGAGGYIIKNCDSW